MDSIERNLNRRGGPMLAVLSAAAVALIVLAACGAPAPAEPAASAPAPAAANSNAAPDFAIAVYQGGEVLGGEEVRFSEILAQGKPVVLNFWAGLCPPCRLEMPDLQAVHEKYQDRVVLVGIDVGVFTGLGDREDGLALLRELNVSYPAGTTPDGEVLRAYQVIGMPSTYFITPDGRIVNTWSGLLNEAKLSELIEELLAAS